MDNENGIPSILAEQPQVSNTDPIAEDIENVKHKPNGAVTEPSAMQVFKTLAETDHEKVLTAVTNKRTIDLIETDAETAQAVDEVAKKNITTHMETQKLKTQKKLDDAVFDSAKNACRVYGVESTVPRWQQTLMRVGSSFWFVIYFIIASVSIAPISTFALKLSVIFKKMWVAIVVAVLVYTLTMLTIILTPILKG